MAETKSKYHFTTRDLVTIAVLGSLGAGFSVYMGYIIAEFFNVIKVWFPVAESLSGVHLIWIVLVLGITNKKGSGTLAGLLKGMVEFLMGSRLGLFVIVLSLAEGIFAELGFWPFRKYRRLSYLLAGGLGTAANVVAFQFYVPFKDPFLFILATVMAFISGVVLAGVFGLGVVDSLEQAGIVRKESKKREGVRIDAVKAAALLVALSILIVIGTVTFLPSPVTSQLPDQNNGTVVADDGIKITVSGSVNAPGKFAVTAYADKFVTMESQEIGNPHGKATYAGLPLKVLLNEAGVKDGATKVDIVGSDGYYNTLELSQAMGDKVLLVNANGEYKLIADGISQEYWVGMIKTIRVY